MDCKEFSNLLDAYLDGALTPEEARGLEAHAAACGDCAALLELRKDCRLLDAEIELTDGFASAWRQRIREEAKMEQKTAHQSGRKRWVAPLAAAAALIFVLGGTVLTRDRLPRAYRIAGQQSSADRGAEMNGAVYGSMKASGSLSNTAYDDYDMDYAEEEVSEDMMAMPAEIPMAAEASAEGMAMKTAAAGEPDEGRAREEKIIRTASFSIKTTAYDADLERLQTLANDLGGRVEYLSSGGDAASGQNRYAYLTLRIPTARLDAFLEEAGQIGSVTDMTQERQDVSDSYYDTQSRLDTQKEKLERLQALMQSAESVSDLVDIESAVADAQYWIDRYTSQLKNYDSRVEYSTVSASLREVKAIEMEDVSLGQRIGEGIRDSLRAGAAFLQDALVFLAAALPWLAAAGLVIGLVCVAVRKGKKRGNQKNGNHQEGEK